MEDKFINNDIYNVREVIDDIKKKYIPEEDEETLELGLYGWLGAVLSMQTVSAIKVSAEEANELFPTRARKTSNVIAHALTNNITDINAVPATISILIGFQESDLDTLFESQGDSVVIDNEIPITLGDYEYHLDYPIILSKRILSNNKSVYTARYDMTLINSLSDIENPYLPSPYVVKLNGQSYV